MLKEKIKSVKEIKREDFSYEVRGAWVPLSADPVKRVFEIRNIDYGLGHQSVIEHINLLKGKKVYGNQDIKRSWDDKEFAMARFRELESLLSQALQNGSDLIRVTSFVILEVQTESGRTLRKGWDAVSFLGCDSDPVFPFKKGGEIAVKGDS